MVQMDAPSKVSMKGIRVSSKRSCQRPVMTEQVQKPKFWRQFRTQARHSYRRRPGILFPATHRSGELVHFFAPSVGGHELLCDFLPFNATQSQASMFEKIFAGEIPR